MTTSEPPTVNEIGSWPPERKQAVLLALLREAVRNTGGRGLIPVEDEAGAMFGYYVPQAVVAEHYSLYRPKLTAEQQAEVRHRIANPGPSFTVAETLEWLREADEAGNRAGEVSATN